MESIIKKEYNLRRIAFKYIDKENLESNEKNVQEKKGGNRSHLLMIRKRDIFNKVNTSIDYGSTDKESLRDKIKNLKGYELFFEIIKIGNVLCYI